MRPQLLALGAAGAFALILAACGGGGGSHATPPGPPATTPATDPNPNQLVNNTNGKTGTMTVTIKAPKTTTASAALKAQARKAGPKHANARIRQLANTSPSASIRATGQQRNAYAKQVQTRTGRSPQFIDGNTELVELVVADSNNNVLTDQTLTCQEEGSCTLTFDVAIGSNLTVSVLTYDDCDYLLAAGGITGVNITAGLNPAPPPITLNGVVANYGVTTSAGQFVADLAGSQAQPSFTVTAVPMDADNNVIGLPGTLIDENFQPIVSVSIAAAAIDNPSFAEPSPGTMPPTNVNPGSQVVNTSGSNTFPPATFAYSGTGSDVNEVFQVTESVTGSSVLPPVFITGPECCGFIPTATPAPLAQFPVTPALAWGSPTGANPSPQFSNGMTSFGLWIAEYPTFQANSVTHAVISNLPGYSGNIVLTDDGEPGCTYFTPTPSEGSYLYSALSSGISWSFNPPANATCQFMITDQFGNTANLEFAANSTTVTVQRKARKH